nr:unnamed protein product [Spirometra erinaceieuropaei]
MAEHAAAVRRNDASSQVAAHSTRSGHTFKFDEAEILARALLPNETFSDLEKFQPNHPLVNSEFYTGWFDTWGQGRHTTPAEQLVAATETLWNYSERVSLNYYMFHGGTNFGFWNGGRSGPDAAITTSYDYDAPISEAGDVTTKYMMLRDLLFK